MPRTRPWGGGWRWVIVAGSFVALFVLGELSLTETHHEARLGVSVKNSHEGLVIAQVQPATLAWDAGIRPGQVVVTVDGRPAESGDEPAAVAAARAIQTRSSDGSVLDVSVAAVGQMSEQRQLSFVMIALEWLIVGGVVFLVAADLFASSVLLILATTAAAALLAAISTPFGTPWLLAVESTTVTLVGAALLVLFLVFPIYRLNTLWGLWAARCCAAVTVALSASYCWFIFVDANGADVIRYAQPGFLAGNILGAIGLAIAAVIRPSSAQREARRALVLVALGVVAGLVPFCFLSLVPHLVGLGYLVPPDIAILSVAFLPASLGAAILGQQFLGVRRFAQRGMIALIVWLGLLGAYTIGLRLLSLANLNSLVLEVAIVAGTFAPLQKVLRNRLERWLLSGVYNYAETLQQLAAEIAALTGVGAIADHVLGRLARTLDLCWAAIALKDNGSKPLVYHWGDCPADLDRQLVVATESPDGEEASPSRTTEGRHLFPLVSEGTTIGHMSVGPKRRDLDLTPDDFALIATIAPLVARSLRNALLMRTLERQVQALSERESALAALSARLMDVQEEERRQLALELHDDPLQRAILLARALGEAPQNPEVKRWRQGVEEIIASLRATCMDLHPPVLDDLGLVPGIERLVNNLRARSDLDVRLIVETDNGGSFGRLDVGLEVALYRVAQEALYNCLKHARATKVVLTLRKDHERIQLAVVDDGQGYKPADGDEHGHIHLGILGMRERLRHWEGTLKVEASVAGGTVVLADVGLGGEYAERQRSAANARCDN